MVQPFSFTPSRQSLHHLFPSSSFRFSFFFVLFVSCMHVLSFFLVSSLFSYIIYIYIWIDRPLFRKRHHADKEADNHTRKGREGPAYPLLPLLSRLFLCLTLFCTHANLDENMYIISAHTRHTHTHTRVKTKKGIKHIHSQRSHTYTALPSPLLPIFPVLLPPPPPLPHHSSRYQQKISL